MDNPLIGFIEGLQFVSGTFNKDDIQRVAPRAQLELFNEISAYGLRLYNQLDDVVDTLIHDQDSRRAVIMLARPDEALELRPCTTSLQFLTINYLLTTIVTMRSSDAIWGLPYDLIQFGIMAEAVSACTGIPTGNIIINIGNAHVYDATADLGVNFKPWTFDLPYLGDTVKGWQDWAKGQLPLISMDYVKMAYNFRPMEGD